MNLLIDNWELIASAIVGIGGVFFGLKIKVIRDLLKEGLEVWEYYKLAKADGKITEAERDEMDEVFGEFFDKLSEAISLFKKKK